MSQEELNRKINDLDAEITELKDDFSIEHFLLDEGGEQLETIITKSIQFGELVNQRDSASNS